jgi:hypothetical protein
MPRAIKAWSFRRYWFHFCFMWRTAGLRKWQWPSLRNCLPGMPWGVTKATSSSREYKCYRLNQLARWWMCVGSVSRLKHAYTYVNAYFKNVIYLSSPGVFLTRQNRLAFERNSDLIWTSYLSIYARGGATSACWSSLRTVHYSSPVWNKFSCVIKFEQNFKMSDSIKIR